MQLSLPFNSLPATSAVGIANINAMTTIIRKVGSDKFKTKHLVNGGIYTRTVIVPAQTMFTGVLLKVPTTLIVVGKISIYIGEKTIRLKGYNVLPGSANRQCAFYTHSTVGMSMCLATKSTSVAEIQKEFTDETHLLVPLENTDEHEIVVTGE
jgi:hypothetical protein